MMKVNRLKIYVLAEDFAGYNSKFWAQHGISFLLDLWISKERHRILFDTGNNFQPVLFNANLLGVNLKDIEYIVISHNHYDHTGGLGGIMKEMNKKIPVFCHPDIFKISFVTEPSFRYIGPPISNFRRDIEKLGGIWILSKKPIQILPGVNTLGEIAQEEKVEYEKITRNDVFKIINGEVTRDFLNDEIGLVINTSKGLVVIAGCSHPGIVSMVKKAIEITKNDDVYSVVGGFHLVNANENRIIKTVKNLKSFGVKEIYTGHCTGLRAECEFQKEFKKNFHKLHTGMVIDISER